MTKYIINDSDFVRIGQKLYRIDPNAYESDYLTSKNASKDYENRLIENGVDAEIFRNGNDQKTTALMQGDIVASKLQLELAPQKKDWLFLGKSIQLISFFCLEVIELGN